MKLLRLLKREWLQIIILAIPIILIAIYYSELPDTIPIHWNIHGEANQYGSKSTIFLIPGISIVLTLVIGFLGSIDPKIAKLNAQINVMRAVRLLITGFLTVLFIAALMASLGKQIDMLRVPEYAVMLLCLLLGIYYPKMPPNYFVGIRTPWTLEDPENWKRTHAFAGRLWVVCSILGLLLALLLPSSLSGTLLLSYVGVLVIPPIAYSGWIFHGKKKRGVNLQ